MSDNSSEKVQIEGKIKANKVIVMDPDGISEFYESSYIGTIEKNNSNGEVLYLDPIEVLLLKERRRILLWPANNKDKDLFDFEGLLTYFTKYDKNLWQKYIIYMDLRKRGYIVRGGYGDGIEFRVFKRGADFREDSARYLIYPVFEGSPIELRDLDKISRVALSSRKDLIVATVDRLSKPIYYSVKKFEILNKDISGDER
ncbi:MAG: tRNA-intron lyase [Candidatus Lokiarchaeota archaeon]|nr:tRNA-intron lyase [Candidatus Lokiarchaeota archaeon]MBD3199515.1 tRNA-intron lyase [Candidatus Lokiarchaeota archaeon]